MSKYTFTKIEDFDVLMKFWSASPDATIFTHPDVLPKLVDQVEWWMAYKGEDPVCLWPICKTGFRNGGYSRFAYYVGPMWSKDHKMLSAHRWLQSSGQVYSGFIDRFKVDRHPTEVSLAPTLTDVRHFLWTNSIPSELPEIQVIPRYTAILDLSDLKPQNILKCVSTNRNREILRIEKSEAFSITKKIETEQALKLYESQSFDRFRNDGRIRFIDGNAAISTYALIDQASVVLTYMSTVGIEAIYWGKPSIVVGNSYYHQLGSVYYPQTVDELQKLLAVTTLQPLPKEAAIKYGYHCEVFGNRIRNYQATGRHSGLYKGIDLDQTTISFRVTLRVLRLVNRVFNEVLKPFV